MLKKHTESSIWL